MIPPLRCASASAPGSLMLMGEHAVLHGRRALCAAVDARVAVHLRPRAECRLDIRSDLGSVSLPLSNLDPAPPFQFVVSAVRAARPRSGLSLEIQAEFPPTLGFGSSAAVTVATVAALAAAAGKPLDRDAVFIDSLRVLREAQGRGSGADLAAATFGGVVLYRADPLEIEPFACHPPLTAHYTGYKTPTADVIRILDELWKGRGAERAVLFDRMDALCGEAAADLRNSDWEQLGQRFNAHMDCQRALGCSDETTETLVRGLLGQPEVLGVKISGSGRGDCVIALGNPSARVPPHEPRPANITTEGVHVDT